MREERCPDGPDASPADAGLAASLLKSGIFENEQEIRAGLEDEQEEALCHRIKRRVGLEHSLMFGEEPDDSRLLKLSQNPLLSMYSAEPRGQDYYAHIVDYVRQGALRA